MIYIAGFALVFCGFCLGIIVAALCCASGRVAKREEKIFDQWKHFEGGTHNA